MTQPSTGPDGHVYIVSAARTPIGKFGGALSAVPAVELGGVAIRAAVERAGLDPATARIDDVLMGQVLQGGVGQAPARQATLRAGSPGHDLGDDHQPGLRLGSQGDHARRGRDQGG